MAEVNNTQAGPETSAPQQTAAPHTPPVTGTPEPPHRRVGSLTLGFCLIAAGIFFLLYYFVPGFDWLLAVKIAPAAALILLGCEVLFFAARPGRWKYDFMSVFVCLILIGCCFCLSFVPALWDEISPQRQQNAGVLWDQYSEQVYTEIKENAASVSVKDITGRLYLYRSDAQTLEQLEALSPSQRSLYVTITLFGSYDSAEAFAKDCRLLTDAIQQLSPLPTQLNFVWDEAFDPAALDAGSAPESYQLRLNGPVQMDWTAEEMARQTTVTPQLDEENAGSAEAGEPAAEAEEESAEENSDAV